MSAREFNPTGNPRRWQGVPGVKYPEEVAAERILEAEEAFRNARSPKHCPPGYVQTRTACLVLHLSEAQTRKVLIEAGVECVQVNPVFGCPYHAWPLNDVERIRDEREAMLKKRWMV